VSGDNGNDTVVGNFGNDSLSGGNGADLLDGDNVDQEAEGPAENPNPNTDTCAGGNGPNQLFFCEIQS
jgi:Ca2+-binding RTX toxin-like protein